MKTVLIWLGAALALGVIAVLVTMSPGSGAGKGSGVVPIGGVVVPVQPPLVRTIEIERPGSPALTIARGDDGLWKLSGVGPTPWDLDEKRVRSFLTLMNQMRAAGEPSPEETIGDDANVVRVTMAEGGPIVVRLAARTLGGMGYIEADVPANGATGEAAGTRRSRVDDGLHRVLAGEGPLAWRSVLPLGDAIAGGVSRVRVRVGGSELALARRDGSWAMQAPIGTRADEDAVQDLLRALAEVRVSNFRDGRETPAAFSAESVIEVERDERVPEGDTVRVRTRTWSVQLGGRTVSGDMFARLGDEGPIVELEGDSVERLVIDPATFVARTSSGTTPSNIGGFELKRAGDPGTSAFRRLVQRAGTWFEQVGTLETRLAPEEASGANAVVEMLCEKPAAGVWLDAPQGLAPMATLTLLSLDGTPGASFEVGTSGGSVVIGDGTVWRSYDMREAPALLAGVLRPEIVPGQPGGAGGTPVDPENVEK